MSRPKSIQAAVPGLRRILRRFWPYIRKQRSVISFSMLGLFSSVGLRLLEPWPLKVVFDRVIPTGHSHRLTGINFIDSLDPLTLLPIAAVAVVLFSGLRALADYLHRVGFSLVGNRVITGVRNELYSHLQSLSLSFHTKARSGDLIVRVTSDISMLKDAAVTSVLPLMANTLIMVGMVGVMFWLQWELAIVGLITIPLFWFFATRIGHRIHDASRKQRKREGAIASTAAESMGAIRVVQTLSLEERFGSAFFKGSQKSQTQDVKTAKLSAALERTVDVLIAIATGLVLWYGAKLVLASALTPGDLLVFLAYLKRAYSPVQDFAKYTARLAKATAAGERVLDLLEQIPEVRDLPDAVAAPRLEGRIQFEKVSFHYQPETPGLHDINFAVRGGQHVLLTGPSGGGKSTLVSLLPRLYDPVAGRVLIDGHDIRNYTLASLRQQISIVLQDSLLFATSVWENISYGALNASREEILKAARLANAEEFITSLPNGFDTILGERGVTISVGQRQRIAIARAAIRQAPILIFDEPTTGLDEENKRLVLEALERLAAGRTTFWITHELQSTTNGELILYLEHGRILEQGTHKDLIEADGRYAAIYRMQSRLNPRTKVGERNHASTT